MSPQHKSFVETRLCSVSRLQSDSSFSRVGSSQRNIRGIQTSLHKRSHYIVRHAFPRPILNSINDQRYRDQQRTSKYDKWLLPVCSMFMLTFAPSLTFLPLSICPMNSMQFRPSEYEFKRPQLMVQLPRDLNPGSEAEALHQRSSNVGRPSISGGGSAMPFDS